MDELLVELWTQINKDAFDGKLEPLAALSFQTLSGSDGIGAHGKYVPQSRCIMIDEHFKPDRSKANNGDPLEQAKLNVTFFLLVHEIVHQSLHQKKAKRPGGHGDEFIAEASRVAKILELEAANKDTAEHWPPETATAMRAVAMLLSSPNAGNNPTAPTK